MLSAKLPPGQRHRLRPFVFSLLAGIGCDSELVGEPGPTFPVRQNEVPAAAETHPEWRRICEERPADRDRDGVCDALERRLGTNPAEADSDGDRLSDSAELGLGPVDLPRMGASPLHKDVFVEIDYYPGLRPLDHNVAAVVDAFANAPITNPDGVPGIALHIQLDDEIDPADAAPNLMPVWPTFDRVKQAYFDPALAPYVRYGLFAEQHNGHLSSGCTRGVPAHDFIVSLGGWEPRNGDDVMQRGTLMHEIGHLLGLQHGGQDNVNYKPHYLSVMNYNYQETGLTVDGVPGVLDFSRVEIAGPDEAALDERTGFRPAPGSATTQEDIARYGFRFCRRSPWYSVEEGFDFDGDGSVSEALIQADLDCDQRLDDELPPSQNDWEALVYHGGGTIGDAFLPPIEEDLRVHYSEIEPCLAPRVDD